jgi:hypothetical protein
MATTSLQVVIPEKTPVVTPTPVAPAPTYPTSYDPQNEVIANDIRWGIKPATTPAETTIADSLKQFGAPTYETDPGLPKEVDENKIRREQMKLFQAEINATNQIYDQMLNEERLRGTGRLGTQRAMSARSGLLGSDFGEANRQGTEAYNKGQTNLVQAERQSKIGAIMGTMRKAVSDEIAAKRLARTQDYDTYTKYLASSKERRQNNLALATQSLFNADLDPTTMDPAELEAIGKEAGLSPNDIINSYLEAKSSRTAAAAESDLKTRKTEAEISKIEADIEAGKVITLGEGTMLYNKETGETFKNPKTYAPTAASGIKIGSGILNQEAIADVHATLQENRGEDGYTDTAKYMAELEGFVALGGDPKDFIKEYSPDIYINPKDDTRSFLQSQMKKTPEEIELTDAQELEQSIAALQKLRSSE